MSYTQQKKQRNNKKLIDQEINGLGHIGSRKYDRLSGGGWHYHSRGLSSAGDVQTAGATLGDGKGQGSLAAAAHGVAKSRPRLGVSRRGHCSSSLGMR